MSHIIVRAVTPSRTSSQPGTAAQELEFRLVPMISAHSLKVSWFPENVPAVEMTRNTKAALDRYGGTSYDYKPLGLSSTTRAHATHV